MVCQRATAKSSNHIRATIPDIALRRFSLKQNSGTAAVIRSSRTALMIVAPEASRSRAVLAMDAINTATYKSIRRSGVTEHPIKIEARNIDIFYDDKQAVYDLSIDSGNSVQHSAALYEPMSGVGNDFLQGPRIFRAKGQGRHLSNVTACWGEIRAARLRWLQARLPAPCDRRQV